MFQIQNLARFDVRTIERYLKDGSISAELYAEYQKYIEREENCGEEGDSSRLWDWSQVKMQVYRRRRAEVQSEDEET